MKLIFDTIITEKLLKSLLKKQKKLLKKLIQSQNG